MEENVPIGTLVHTVEATDIDSGVNGMVLYELQSEGVPFEIDRETGVITTSGVIDFEENQFYNLYVIGTNETLSLL